MNNAANPVFSNNDAAQRQHQDTAALPADQRMSQALARLDASRSALIVCMTPDPPAGRGRTAGQVGDAGAETSIAKTLVAQIARNGLLQGSWRTVRTLTRRWWTRQPWHSSVDLVGQTLAHEARPLMRRHPLATLAVGAAFGAGLVAVVSAARPWAWQHVRRQGNPWRDRIGSLLWSQLTSAPVQMTLFGALAAWLSDQGSRTTGSSQQATGTRPPSARADVTANAETPDIA